MRRIIMWRNDHCGGVFVGDVAVVGVLLFPIALVDPILASVLLASVPVLTGYGLTELGWRLDPEWVDRHKERLRES